MLFDKGVGKEMAVTRELRFRQLCPRVPPVSHQHQHFTVCVLPLVPAAVLTLCLCWN